MIDRARLRLRRLRRGFSRSEWLIKLLGLSVSEGTECERGVIIVQIDGLARKQLEKAIERGRMPFLKKLLKGQGHRLHTHYSGIPSSTPAVQGELFYGVRSAVPAFSYRDKKCGRVFRMFCQDDAIAVEERLAAGHEGLLKGGSAYCNIYTAGAAEAHFCAPTLGWEGFWKHGSPWALPLAFLLHSTLFVRTAALIVLEVLIGLYDFMAAPFGEYGLIKEFKFIPARVGVSIFAREVITIGAQMDLARGLPIIHLNYLGYDEQSHRRGPSSAFAHWGLKGIDGAVKRLWKSAKRSPRRDYDVWIFSDHGQEDVIPYEQLCGRTVESAIMEVFDGVSRPARKPGRRVAVTRRGFGFRGWDRSGDVPAGADAEAKQSQEPVIAAMGPIGHLYWPAPLNSTQREELAMRLVKEAEIPIVLARDEESDQVFAWNAKGKWRLPQDAADILGADHHALETVARDFADLCRHPEAGDLVFSGWRPRDRPISFPAEYGSHAGPGRRETEGFAILPVDAPLAPADPQRLRPSDLRNAALELLGRRGDAPEPFIASRPSREFAFVRVMTYNVHSCVGMDGKLSPKRIARMILRHDPDVVCLQELDVGRLRSRNEDQAHLIARELEMDHHFHPALRVEEEQYGDAILSRLPMRLVKAGSLPGNENHPKREPRGAIWVEVQTAAGPLNVINTHFGLSVSERRRQAHALLGPGWLDDPRCQGATLLCGDFNAIPGSAVHRMLRSRLRDAQKSLENHRPRPTWRGIGPLGRIDHVFVNELCKVTQVKVDCSALALAASDHNPLIVDLIVETPAFAEREPAGLPPLAFKA